MLRAAATSLHVALIDVPQGGALTRLPISAPLQLPEPQATTFVVGASVSPDGSRIAAIVSATAPSVFRLVTGVIVADRDGRSP